MIINDDCRINLILGEFKKSQSEEIPRQSTRNEKIICIFIKIFKI